MIAVFSRYSSQFDELVVATPQSKFKRITGWRDVIGTKFSGIIRLHQWTESDDKIMEAYDELFRRQPELFDLKRN